MLKIIKFLFVLFIFCSNTFAMQSKANGILKKEAENVIEYVSDYPWHFKRHASFNKKNKIYTAYINSYGVKTELSEEQAEKLYKDLEEQYYDVLGINDEQQFPSLVETTKKKKKNWPIKFI